MKRLYLLLPSMLMAVAPLRAQFSIGIQAGAGRNYLHTDISNRPFTAYKASTIFEVGVPVRYTFNTWLSAQTGLQFAQKNYELYRSGYYDGIYEKTINNYLQLPVMAHFSFGGPKIKGFLDLGGYTAWWMSSKRKGTQPNMENVVETPEKYTSIFDMYRPYHYSEKYTFNGTKDRRMEWGGLAGIGVEYSPVPNYLLFITGRYTVAFTDQQKNYMVHLVPRYNETFSVQLGGMITISR